MNQNENKGNIGMLTEQGDLGLGFTVLEGANRQTVIDDLVNKEKKEKEK